MRKIYSFIAVVAMVLMAGVANAATFNLPEDNTVLKSEAYNMLLNKTVNFVDQTVNGVEALINFDTSLTTDEIKFNGYAPYQCSTEGLTFVWTAVGNTGFASGYGLRNTGSGPRGFLLQGMKAGQILVVQGTNSGYNTGNTDSSYNGFCIPNGSRYNANTGWVWELFDPLQVEDISPEIHDAQKEIARAEAEANGEPFDEENFQHDGFLYLKVIQDGWVSLPIERSASVQGFQIWIDAAADEFVTAPAFTMTGVNYSTRYGDVVQGESSIGNTVTTWFSLDGSDPIFLKETDEIESEEVVYTYDDEGNVIDEQTIVTYKKVLDPIEDGIFGEMQYFPEDGISFDETNDEDGDGYVTLKIASVSESGKSYSDIVTYSFAVNEITLNQPTLTLVGINGMERTYQIGWTNNTLCKEPYTFSANCDGDLYDGLVLGDYVSATQGITVTVSSNGYIDGVYELSEVMNQGVNMYRKNKEKEALQLHDWDFVLGYDQTELKDKIRGKEIAYCYLEGAEDVHYTPEEYENGEAADGTDLSGAIVAYADYGWDWDGGNLRATLRVLKTEVEPDVWEPIEGGYDFNDAGFGYNPDVLGIVNRDGLNISCPPNTKNNSCILQYIDKADGDGSLLGIYFMARPTLTFQRDAAEYGDYVLIYQGQGGSNYTNNRWPTIAEVPADELLSVQLANNGVHLFYIDIYTSDKPDDYEDPYVTGIETVKKQNINNGIVYTIDGRIVNRNADLNGLQKGLYILNGKKIIIK